MLRHDLDWPFSDLSSNYPLITDLLPTLFLELTLTGMVLDSPFSDLSTLAEEIVDKGRKNGLFAPGFLVYIALRWIRSSVQKAAGFDIKALSPIKHVDKCFIPALFVAGKRDEFVPPHHSQQLYDKYAGDKNIVLVRKSIHDFKICTVLYIFFCSEFYSDVLCYATLSSAILLYAALSSL